VASCEASRSLSCDAKCQMYHLDESGWLYNLLRSSRQVCSGSSSVEGAGIVAVPTFITEPRVSDTMCAPQIHPLDRVDVYGPLDFVFRMRSCCSPRSVSRPLQTRGYEVFWT
jgi:hypothetical protein